ncbi:hypothetical protein Tco_1569333 [Tanacetum coccineum]
MAGQHIKVRLENDMNGVLIQRTLSLSQKLKPDHPTVALPKHLGNTEPIRAHPLDLRRQEDGNDKGKGVDKRAEDTGDEDLQPYKEVLQSPFTQQIIDVSVDVRWSDNRLVRPVTERLNRKLGGSSRKIHKETLKKMNKEMNLHTQNSGVKQISAFHRAQLMVTLIEGAHSCREGSSLRRDKEHHTDSNHLSLDALTKRQKEILAIELQLQLPPCTPMVGTPKKENLDRYCDYHGEKGHYTNDCYQLKKQLEAALEYEKLSHLVKDVRQRGNARGRQQGNNNDKGRSIWYGRRVTTGNANPRRTEKKIG